MPLNCPNCRRTTEGVGAAVVHVPPQPPQGVWKEVPLPPADQKMSFSGGQVYAILAEVNDGYSLDGDVVAGVQSRGWSVHQDGLWMEGMPIPAEDASIVGALPTAASGRKWVFGKADAPPAGDSIPVDLTLLFKYRYTLHRVWVFVPPGGAACACPAQTQASYTLPIVGGVVAGAALGYGVAWAWRRWGRRLLALRA